MQYGLQILGYFKIAFSLLASKTEYVCEQATRLLLLEFLNLVFDFADIQRSLDITICFATMTPSVITEAGNNVAGREVIA
jgi:hypothetical protein